MLSVGAARKSAALVNGLCSNQQANLINSWVFV